MTAARIANGVAGRPAMGLVQQSLRGSLIAIERVPIGFLNSDRGVRRSRQLFLIAARGARSWIGRTGDGYRYDYFHVGRELADRITTCTYLHETRERRLSDHAAVALELGLDAVERLTTGGLTDDKATLF